MKFLGLDFKTTKDTFIPRPETELLVKECIKALSAKESYILDIGTGCGNIAVSLTKFTKNSRMVALDISEETLKVAHENARIHKVFDKIEFINSDLFENLGQRSFDIIVSNPPYIPSWEIDTLAEHVKAEPRAALNGGEDGLDFYRRIISESPRYLRNRGYLIMEVGYNQSHYIKRMLLESKNFTNIEIFKDLSNIYRVIKAERWISS